jgi:hypothetical protein
MIGFGFVKEWHTLLPLRLLLGIFEAGFFPGKCHQQRFPHFYLSSRHFSELPSSI